MVFPLVIIRRFKRIVILRIILVLMVIMHRLQVVYPSLLVIMHNLQKPSAMALGTASLSSGFNSLAMMRQSAATGNSLLAIGTTSWASGTGSFVLGYSAQSKGDQSIAIGAAEPITVAGGGNEPSAAYKW